MPNTQEQIWARMVARATPNTPQENTSTNTRSSTILMTQAMNRKIRGVRLSPRPRMMPLFML